LHRDLTIKLVLISRKIVFHAGPTNSGKTYHALERFNNAKTGVYCGPLKLLATEVFNKTNERGVPCDLVTGEERKFASSDGGSTDSGEPSGHVACTVEMANFSQTYEVSEGVKIYYACVKHTVVLSMNASKSVLYYHAWTIIVGQKNRCHA
jgi:hypothetical protein